MSIIKLTVFFLCATLVACAQDTKKGGTDNPKAKLLSDSANKLIQNSKLAEALELFNKAVKLDTNYYQAYQAKVSLELIQKKFDKALLSSIKVNEFRPERADFTSRTGVLYLKNGDSSNGKRYLEKALQQYDKITDTLTKQNYDFYFDIMAQKAFCLILLDRNNEANHIFSDLQNTALNKDYIEVIFSLRNRSKAYILDSLLEGR